MPTLRSTLHSPAGASSLPLGFFVVGGWLFASCAGPVRSDEAAPRTADWLAQTGAHEARITRTYGPEVLTLDNGLVRRVFRLEPNAACIAFDQRTTGESLLRAIRPEARVTLDGVEYAVGGLLGQPVQNYVLPEWLGALASDPTAFQFESFGVEALTARFEWRPREEWLSRPAPWPPRGQHVVLRFAPGENGPQGVRIDVHYEIYDGLPLLAKWFTLTNNSARAIELDAFTSEVLALVEPESLVESSPWPARPNLHVETDCTLVGSNGDTAQRKTVRWLRDPSYSTQVSYPLETLCLLECAPPLGPDVLVAAGESFESFRTWELAFDSHDPKRRALTLARMYRTIAPWSQENPLIFHVRSAQDDAVRAAIDQAAEVGFELVIMTFGSGFSIENPQPDYLARIKALADYAHSKGVALGGYSLLASRSIGAAHDVVNPATGKPGGFATFGDSPCIESEWGRAYFDKLYAFFEATGCDVLEHDGSYPGDACASTSHPGHRGYDDSYWRQRESVTRFYRWCRARGVYLNVPDWWFLNGSSKCAMGYRETNWSLPREQQELIERQNIHDGVRFKTPTMGWMFVPLTEYHGGGAAATIEPLNQHLEHYEQRLANLLGAGVQACWRGPRLYDTEPTKELVARWVAWFKEHRRILESDLVALRRADGRDWDGWLHVDPDPQAAERALAALYNPLAEALSRTVRLPLGLAGLQGRARISIAGAQERVVELDSHGELALELEFPARGFVWIVARPDD
jgi:hypothetical protein